LRFPSISREGQMLTLLAGVHPRLIRDLELNSTMGAVRGFFGRARQQIA
jgi:hypothetical protein